MGVEDCLAKTLQRWLNYQSCVKPTWFALNQALQSKLVLDTAGMQLRCIIQILHIHIMAIYYGIEGN